MTVKRYYRDTDDMYESEDGPFVYYDDYADAESNLRAEREAHRIAENELAAERAKVERLKVELDAATAAIDIAGPALEALSEAGAARATSALLEMRVAAVAAVKSATLSSPPAEPCDCHVPPGYSCPHKAVPERKEGGR